ncbi:MAG: hypothetical protein JO016_08390 [Actinobacteria bacterium]|nr:hypothetical protein [Actinomycetota bacterium]
MRIGRQPPKSPSLLAEYAPPVRPGRPPPHPAGHPPHPAGYCEWMKPAAPSAQETRYVSRYSSNRPPR